MIDNDVRFKSKVDAWLVIFISVALLTPLILFFARHGARMPPDRGATMFIVTGLSALFVVWLFKSTEYVVTATELIVRSGPVNQRVLLKEITRIHPTRSILSAPALSLDRMEIAYGKYGGIVISPADKRGFLNCVKERSPGVDVSAFGAAELD